MSRFDLGCAGLVRIAAASAWMALLWRGMAVGLVLLPEAAGAAPPRAAADAPKGQPSPHAEPQKNVSASALMQAVYDGQSWLDKARSFRIRSEENITWTEEYRRWREQQPLPGPVRSSDRADPRQFSVRIEWAWDEQRVRRTHAVVHPGETLFSRDTRIWDGSLAVAYNELPDRKLKQYTLGNKVSRLFNEIIVRDTIEIPWAPGGPHDFWWLPKDVEGSRTMRYLAPEDFELEGQETVNGRPCRVVLSRAGHYRMHIGMSNGRLYRQTWLIARPGGRATTTCALPQDWRGGDQERVSVGGVVGESHAAGAPPRLSSVDGCPVPVLRPPPVRRSTTIARSRPAVGFPSGDRATPTTWTS